MVEWLGLDGLTAMARGPVPGQETKILWAACIAKIIFLGVALEFTIYFLYFL